jgi:hypothetical protein
MTHLQRCSDFGHILPASSGIQISGGKRGTIMIRTIRAALTLVFVAFLLPAAASEPLKITGDLRVRGEHWDWFETPAADGKYTFLGATLLVGAGQKLSGLDWNVQLAVPILAGLPDDAIAPAPQGQLGLGATYFAVNGDTEASSLFIKQGWIGLKGPGRFGFIDGMERRTDDANLMWLKNQRIAQRLIGTFGFTHVGRSFDGVHFSHETGHDNITLVAAAPTVGVFEAGGMSTISDVAFAYGSYTRETTFAPGELRAFAIQYEDGRGVTKTDNRPAPARGLDRDDVSVTTLGGHWAQTFPSSAGTADVVLWGAWQTGDWGVQSHSGTAYALEAGYRFENLPSAPWIRAGYFSGSGDDDPLDDDHDTFFQILPTPRVYARFPAYNLMNNEDSFVQIFLQPGTGWALRADYHRIELNEGSDLWYAGGGAFNESAFGYVARPGFSQKGLMDVIDLSVAYRFSSRYSGTLYLSTASGDDLIDVIYPNGSDARYIYLELEAKF